jgi:hypothetical protein
MQILQEKFQITEEDPQTDGGNEWAVDAPHRSVVLPTMAIRSSRPGAPNQADFSSPQTNAMPAGMFIDNQIPQPNDHTMQYVTSGATDPTGGVTGATLKRGFRAIEEVVATPYTNPQVENFYDEVTVDGKTGFLKRNNYLDRE